MTPSGTSIVCDRGETEDGVWIIQTPTSGGSERLTVRSLHTRRDFEQCKALQEDIFGPPVIASSVVLQTCRSIGGLAVGVFTAQEELWGCLFGISGVQDGRPAHWSNFTAVVPQARGLGLGRLLKTYSRDVLLARSIDTVFWSFDPTTARNAQLNLQRLGAHVVDFVRDYYAESSSNPPRSPFDHDRLIVRWDLASDRVGQALDGGLRSPKGWKTAPVVNVDHNRKPLTALLQTEGPVLRIQIPRDMPAYQRRVPDDAVAWRQSVRLAFEHLLADGYGVAGFALGAAHGFYVLHRSE